MNRKMIISLIVTGVLCFTLGWLLNDLNLFKNKLEANESMLDSSPKEKSNHAKITQNELDSLKIIANINNISDNFSRKLYGQFLMKNANCAGFNFINPTCVAWTNEMDCGHPDTLKIRWLDNATFYTQDIIQVNKNCAPRVWIYQVVSFDGIHLILKDIWTGWNNQADEKIEFVKSGIKVKY